jgi:DNA repair exonuclease SbcCD nuclease subunit
MRFIHTADLQIGARFSQFGDKATALRAARVQALARILDIAEAESADAVLIAGDMFEDNQVADALVRDVMAVLDAHASVPVVILPGNHDPVSGPGCVWMRPPFDNPPDHVTVCTSTSPVNIADAVLLPSPITQKRSTRDPALPLVDLAAAVPAATIKIGLTHGSLAIESKHQPDDHPIALNAATRAGLDYLAVGHWHSFMQMDKGRLVMPGTPEPDQFGQVATGVVIVDIECPGASPTLKQLPCPTFAWHECPVDVAADGDVESLVASAVADIEGAPETVVLRLRLHGATDPTRRRAFEAAAAALSATYAVVQVQDDTVIRLSDAMWLAWQQEHPLLAQVVADVEQARLFAAGTPPDVAAEALAVLTLPELRGICSDIGIAESDLSADVLETARELLIGQMSAVAAEESTS